MSDVAPTLDSHFCDKQGLENQHINAGGGCLLPSTAKSLTAHMHRLNSETETFVPTGGSFDEVAHALRADGFDASKDGTGRGTPLVSVVNALTERPDRGGGNSEGQRLIPLAFASKDHGADAADTLTSNGDAHSGFRDERGLVAFDWNNSAGAPSSEEVFGTLASRRQMAAMQGMAVRRLTPRECERLQGFHDDYTLVPYRKKPAADGPRYKALGNSMSVNCMRWIGYRLAAVEKIVAAEEARVA